jgi:hypothetical protein
LNDELTLKLRLIEGEEEETFLEKAKEDMKNFRKKGKKGGGRQGSRFSKRNQGNGDGIAA